MNTQYAANFLDINLLTEAAVKNAYRTAAKKHHPDIGGNPEIFKELQIVYKFALANLVFASDREITKIDRENIRTTANHKLNDLGKGFDSTTNGSTCEVCEGIGYRTTTEYGSCPDCDGNGTVVVSTQCSDCNGTGKFQQRKSKRIVDCRTCKGTGIQKSQNLYQSFFSFNFNFHYGRSQCTTCNGTGLTATRTIKYHTCSHCEGVGEIKMMNPVIKKGSLLF